MTRNPDSGGSQREAYWCWAKADKRRQGTRREADQGRPERPLLLHSWSRGCLRDLRERELYAALQDPQLTSVWASYNGKNSDEAAEIEENQSWSAVEASVAAGAKHVVYSTLETYQPRQKLPHFDAKSRVTAKMKKANVPATQVYASYFYQNLLSAKWKQQGDQRILGLPMPDDALIPALDVSQIGLWIRVALDDPETWIGESPSHLTGMNRLHGG